MNNETKIKEATQQLVISYCNSYKKPILANNIWHIMYNIVDPFLNRVKALNELVVGNEFLTEISEPLFDLLMVYHLSVEEHDEDYFDSNEWNQIESKTLERGSEFLNLLLYISEANENEVEVSLEDFLNEFLLVEEDEFQDEFIIYESFIANPDIVDAELDDIIFVKNQITKDTGISAFFVPFTLFFKHAGENSFPDYSGKISAFELAILKSLLAYHN